METLVPAIGKILVELDDGMLSYAPDSEAFSSESAQVVSLACYWQLFPCPELDFLPCAFLAAKQWKVILPSSYRFP